MLRCIPFYDALPVTWVLHVTASECYTWCFGWLSLMPLLAAGPRSTPVVPVLSFRSLTFFKSKHNAFSLTLSASSLFIFYYLVCGVGVLALIGCKYLSLSLALLPIFNNNNISSALGFFSIFLGVVGFSKSVGFLVCTIKTLNFSLCLWKWTYRLIGISFSNNSIRLVYSKYSSVFIKWSIFSTLLKPRI